jgi:DNA-directed RNA polymerase specialized sigma24 family protein
VDSPSPLKKDWVLTQEALDTLLARLDPDRDRAAQQYEHIRRALVVFFECRGTASPEDLADTVINRAARRLVEGQTIHTETPAAYFYGVARNVLKESWDAAKRAVSLDQTALPPRLSVDPEGEWDQAAERRLRERRLQFLERCLGELSDEARDLIGSYYQGDSGAKIKNRRRLAARLDIPINALRIRALRIRERLEACVKGAMARESR